jgi:hypothetical protein
MTHLFVKIDFNSELNVKFQLNKNKFIDGKVNLYVERTHNSIYDEKALFYNKYTNVLCLVLGYISNIEEMRAKYSISHTNDVEFVEELYSLKNF